MPVGRREGVFSGVCQYKDCMRVVPEVRLICPAGRPDAVGCYCPNHGGQERARAEAEQDWNWLAPPSVGGERAVKYAGNLCLHTTQAYVVLRELPEAQGGVWLAFLGLGGSSVALANPDAKSSRRGGRRANNRSRKSGGVFSFPDKRSAEVVAHDTWHRVTSTRVEAITRARGGTLDWGTPVKPLQGPIVITVVASDPRNPWEVAEALPRLTPSHVNARKNGLRASGEIE